MWLRPLGALAWLLLSPAMATRTAMHSELKVQTGVVPALVSRAMRVVMRDSREAVLAAEALQKNASAKREEARQKQEAAHNKSQEMGELVAKTQEKEQRLLAKQQEVSELMTTENESQQEWRTKNSELEQMQQNLTNESGSYAELKKQIEQEIVDLTNKQRQAYERLGHLQNAVDEKQAEVLQLREAAESHGSIARKASLAADEVEADLAQVRELWGKQQISAEAAEQDFLHAKMDADAAERAQIDATREMARLSDVKKLVVAARNSVQSLYLTVDDLTRSVEKRFSENTTGRAAWQIFREDPNTRSMALSYNAVTAAFRRLYIKSKDMYMFMAGSVDEIHENTQAAVMMLCDPDGSLEEESRSAGNFTSYSEKCGQGLWKFLGIERQSFPGKEHDRTVDEDMDKELLPVKDEGGEKMLTPLMVDPVNGEDEDGGDLPPPSAWAK
ncbi:Centrosomal protein of 76 kDa [Durusdinium trenchii]|uniref:Centrosomal protein of 76 kDa n=1 Tax=Durusdinium trenchii TaxID=1381693 RepID=A0ABP0QQP5_9DINO